VWIYVSFAEFVSVPAKFVAFQSFPKAQFTRELFGREMTNVMAAKRKDLKERFPKDMLLTISTQGMRVILASYQNMTITNSSCNDQVFSRQPQKVEVVFWPSLSQAY
jgi:hypothetical protein